MASRSAVRPMNFLRSRARRPGCSRRPSCAPRRGRSSSSYEMSFGSAGAGSWVGLGAGADLRLHGSRGCPSWRRRQGRRPRQRQGTARDGRLVRRGRRGGAVDRRRYGRSGSGGTTRLLATSSSSPVSACSRSEYISSPPVREQFVGWEGRGGGRLHVPREQPRTSAIWFAELFVVAQHDDRTLPRRQLAHLRPQDHPVLWAGHEGEMVLVLVTDEQLESPPLGALEGQDVFIGCA